MNNEIDYIPFPVDLQRYEPYHYYESDAFLLADAAETSSNYACSSSYDSEDNA